MPDHKALAGITVAVVNLPHAERLIRRYMCTYRSPYFYFPPHDLLQVASCIREWTGARVVFLDAIAENCDEAEVAAFLRQHQPAFMVALLGVESVATDAACADRLRQAVPGMRAIVFGYYASRYAKEILEKSQLDAVLRGDPELSCCAYMNAAACGEMIRDMPGVACRVESGRTVINDLAYLDNLDVLPPPDYSLVALPRYNEMLLGGPFAAVQTSRGCPYRCTYCTSPMERRFIHRAPERVVDEMEALVRLGARVIRVLDDTFTCDKARVIAICRMLIARNVIVHWSCLSRVDTLDAEMLAWMKRAGCVRVVVGVESYAPVVLQALGKQIDPTLINDRLQLVREAGIECVGFIMVGGPFEDDAAFERTRRGLLRGPFDLAIIDAVAIYGDTPLYKRYRHDIEFQLIPYISRWRDAEIGKTALKRERTLYRQFYFRPRIVWRQLRVVIRFPARSIRLFLLLMGFIVSSRRPRDRQDLF